MKPKSKRIAHKPGIKPITKDKDTIKGSIKPKPKAKGKLSQKPKKVLQTYTNLDKVELISYLTGCIDVLMVVDGLENDIPRA
jgi:hypothetical protein